MAISRHALAAALLEYDNDNLPAFQQRDHRQSAIFSLRASTRPVSQGQFHGPTHEPLREHDGPSRRRPGSSSATSPRLSERPNSRLSGSGLSRGWEEVDRPNADAEEDDAEEEDATPDVDIDRWDLPEHLVAKDTRPASRISTVHGLAEDDRTASRQSRHDLPPLKSPLTPHTVPRPKQSPFQSRAVSIHLDRTSPDPEPASMVEREGGAHAPPEPRRRTISFEPHDARRRTVSDFAGIDAALASAERVRDSSARAMSIMGFPTDDPQYRDRQISNPIMLPLPASPSSTFRPVSALSRGRSFELDRRILDEEEEQEQTKEPEEDLGPNPFALPAPPASLASRFDPKTMPTPPGPGSTPEHEQDITDPRRASRPDLRRPMSMANLDRLNRYNDGNATPPDMGEEMNDPLAGRPVYDDLPSPDQFGKALLPPKYARRRPVDRHTLMRPKTLIMPAGLAGAEKPPPAKKVPEGFTLGDKPLPAAARSSILSLGDGRAFGAAFAQEQIEQERLRVEEEQRLLDVAADGRRERMPGKLYGTSLMDQLEARKQHMRSKQRVFTGDSRPAMMARQSMMSLAPLSNGPVDRAPLLSFDSNGNLAATGVSPTKSAYLAPYASTAVHDPQHDSEGRPRMSKSKSVFGVDQIWEKEMAKLKAMQAVEADKARMRAAREEEERVREQDRLARAGNRKSFWGGAKGKGRAGVEVSPAGESAEMVDLSPAKSGAHLSASSPSKRSMIEIEGGVSPVRRAPDLPPMLSYSPERRKPVPVPEEESADDGSPPVLVEPELEDDREERIMDQPQRDAESDSEDEAPLSRLRPAAAAGAGGGAPRLRVSGVESDSDEEIPLSRLRVASNTSKLAGGETDFGPAVDVGVKLNSDLQGSLGLSVPALPPSVSPRPPSHLVPGPSPSPLESGSGGEGRPAEAGPELDSEEEDDVPLGVRASRLVPSASMASGLSAGVVGVAGVAGSSQAERPEGERDEIEDDLPLGYKHAAAVSRRVASGQGAPGEMGTGTGTGMGMGMGMDGAAAFHATQQQQQGGMGWGMGTPSIYGGPQYLGYGQGQGQGHAGWPAGMPGMGMGMGYPQQHPQSYAGMGMGIPSPYMGMGMGMGMGGGMPGQMGGYGGALPYPQAQGLGPSGMPGANIDSWRQNIRAPSTVAPSVVGDRS